MQNSTIHCLVEFDIGMDRCGINTHEKAYALAAQIKECSNLEFMGIQAYAGNLAHEFNYNDRRDGSEDIKQRLSALKQYLEERGIPVKEISGISTGTVQFHAQNSVYTEIQSGSYLLGDTTYEAVGVNFKHALFVLSSVMHKHDHAIITDAGLKTVSVDQNPPVFKGFEQYPVSMSEEHAAIYGENLPLEIGDHMLMIPSHCCTEMNLHDHIYFIRKGVVVDRVPITSRGRSL
jgi:3-hydroxy-D-aspartate aldolase